MSSSFLFIVDELATNDSLDISGTIDPRMVGGHWRPPTTSLGYSTLTPGYVFRWQDGGVTWASEYRWDPTSLQIYDVNTGGWPALYRAATVFYSNRFDKFDTLRGDARKLEWQDPSDTWQPLFFHHDNDISLIDHAGSYDRVLVRHPGWTKLFPKEYRSDEKGCPKHGGLAGLLPLVIAMVAFSCSPDPDELYSVLITDHSWRDNKWYPHERNHGWREGRGVVVKVYLDPANTQYSTFEDLGRLEYGQRPIFR